MPDGETARGGRTDEGHEGKAAQHNADRGGPGALGGWTLAHPAIEPRALDRDERHRGEAGRGVAGRGGVGGDEDEGLGGDDGPGEPSRPATSGEENAGDGDDGEDEDAEGDAERGVDGERLGGGRQMQRPGHGGGGQWSDDEERGTTHPVIIARPEATGRGCRS